MQKLKLKSKKILITCGPTCVPIDDMRTISNRSTGELGHILASQLNKLNADVTLVEGQVTHLLDIAGINKIKFVYFNDLLKILRQNLKNNQYDVVIHAAAVSDYKLKESYNTKLKSGLPELILKLVPTKKIINMIKKWSPDSLLVGFKLESVNRKSILIDKASTLIDNADCDLVVANSLNKKCYVGYILDSNKNIVAQGNSRLEIAKSLIQNICEIL